MRPPIAARSQAAMPGRGCRWSPRPGMSHAQRASRRSRGRLSPASHWRRVAASLSRTHPRTVSTVSGCAAPECRAKTSARCRVSTVRSRPLAAASARAEHDFTALLRSCDGRCSRAPGCETSSGRRSGTPCATIPPSEQPTKYARTERKPAARARSTSSARSSIENGSGAGADSRRGRAGRALTTRNRAPAAFATGAPELQAHRDGMQQHHRLCRRRPRCA